MAYGPSTLLMVLWAHERIRESSLGNPRTQWIQVSIYGPYLDPKLGCCYVATWYIPGPEREYYIPTLGSM